AVCVGGHGNGIGGLTHLAACSRTQARRQNPGRHEILRHGEALRDRRCLQGRRSGATAARRLWLSGRLRGGADRARSTCPPYSRRHQRNHARHHFARNAEGMSRDTKSEAKAIGTILRKDWDPIGAGVPEDEYESYIWPIYKLLIEGVSREKI